MQTKLNVGPALSGLGFGDTLWIKDGVAEMDAIHALGFPRVSIPWWMFGPAGQVATSVGPTVAHALSLGMDARVPFHCDGDNSKFEYVAFDSPPKYLADFQDALTALRQGIPASRLKNLTIEVGNEVSGRSFKDWGPIRNLYTGLWRQCAAAARQILPGCRVVVPAPFDQQMGLLAQAMQPGALPASCLTGPTTSAKSKVFDAMAVHYPTETIGETPGSGAHEVATFLTTVQKFYGLPLETSECTPAAALQTAQLGMPTDIWQWISKDGMDQVKGNSALLGSLGMTIAAT